jgi:hypothetical protein
MNYCLCGPSDYAAEEKNRADMSDKQKESFFMLKSKFNHRKNKKPVKVDPL